MYVGSLTKAMSEATFWFTTVLTVTLSIVPVLAWRFYFYDVFPTLSDKVSGNFSDSYFLGQTKHQHEMKVSYFLEDEKTIESDLG